MALGVAVRFALCTNMLISETVKGASSSTELARCCWSLFILDRIHGSSFRILPAISEESLLPGKPSYTRRPNIAAPTSDAPDIGDERDEGITSYALQLLSIWGRLMAYLKSIKQGNLEDAWVVNSTYQQIKAEMSRFETVFPEAHRFKNTRFHEITTSDLAKQREYWAPWIFTQCIYHTIHCTLNHPFLHVARIHGRQRLRSPSFLQHATDQAILHSAWVVYILRLCEERHFAIYDPFIGHLASMIATAQFFLQFSKDESVASTSSKHFETLRQFVENMATEHHQLRHTVRFVPPIPCGGLSNPEQIAKLSKLAQLEGRYVGTLRTLQPPKVETALLWDLLDYAVSSSSVVSSGGFSDDVELSVNTQFLNNQFLSPVNPDGPHPQQDVPPGQSTAQETFAANLWDDTAFQFDMADFSTFPEMYNLTMPNDSWVNGHL